MKTRTRTALGSTVVVLVGMTVWAQGPGPDVLESRLERQHNGDPARDARYDVANHVFLLEIQEKSLRAQLLEAESKVNALRSEIQKTKKEIIRARSLVNGGALNKGTIRRHEIK